MKSVVIGIVNQCTKVGEFVSSVQIYRDLICRNGGEIFNLLFMKIRWVTVRT